MADWIELDEAILPELVQMAFDHYRATGRASAIVAQFLDRVAEESGHVEIPDYCQPPTFEFGR